MGMEVGLYEYVGMFEVQEGIYADFRLNNKTKTVEVKYPHGDYITINDLKAKNKQEARVVIDNWRLS